MKKTYALLAGFLALSSVFAFGCNTGEKNGDDAMTYEQLYAGNANKKYAEVKSGELNRASYGYKFNDAQGYNGWHYISLSNGVQSELIYSDGSWTANDGGKICDGIISSSSTPIGYLYSATANGDYEFCLTLKKSVAGDGGATVTVYKNGDQIGTVTVDENDLTGKYYSAAISLNEGDSLKFLVSGKNAYLNPTVAPSGGLDYSLYTTHNDWGYYGDLHCYYYNDTVYMYHLWNHDPGFALSGFIWHMQTSTDMFRYYNTGYDDSFIENHYMAYGKSPDVTDYSQYTSSRDCTVFYDEDVGVKRHIGLCYRPSTNGEINCDLALRTSSDKLGMEWNTPAVTLRSFPTTADGEPECSQLIKIGDRWYLSAGISGQSVHGVGTASYWVGGKGQTIDEVDWQSLSTNKIDGEDLAVPQIENIGGRYYLYGWMPRQYNGGYWGGYKNLPREVYVKDDGTLGTRIDEMATKLLNKGKLFSVDDSNVITKQGSAMVSGNTVRLTGNENAVSINGNTGRTFVTYNVSMGSATQVAYTMTVGNLCYRLVISRQNDGVYLIVDCPNDVTNRESSRVYLCESGVTDFTVKAVIEGGIVEFAVNDTMVLSGRTSMNNLNYTAGFYSNGTATVSDININRIAQYYDVYD